MDKNEVVVIDLEQLAAAMALALPSLKCPECCGPVYEFVEVGARFYQEEWEWACLANAIVNVRLARRARAGGT
jgi:hypothetical protein